ncbi:MAG: DNA mismatch repair endonuclease MutL, partial [Ruminococcus sp.]
MGVINVLDKHVADLIAAGEVVERPASAIKELIENSIDAGAKNITVEIMNGGTTFMRVTDDGCGIMRDDIKVAFLPHATSKIKIENDLDSISTLGFRGEALSSISSVSKVQILTRYKDDELGTVYEIEGGEEINFDDAGCPVGTTLIIRDLFYNIPARMKFLKKDVSEGNAVANVVDKEALAHPEISFTFIRDGKQTLKTSGDSKLKSAIYSVYGRDFANGLLPVNYELNGIEVKGYISKPVNSRPNRSMQNFFINGRYVKSRTAMVAIEEACKGSIMVGKFPACVLHISMSLEAVDVNVHPSKIEVRFLNERPIYDALYHGVKTALNNFDQRKNITFGGQKSDSVTPGNRSNNPFSFSNTVVFEPKKEPMVKSQPKSDPIAELDMLFPKKDSSIDLDNAVFDTNNPFDVYSKEAINHNERKSAFVSHIENEIIEENVSKAVEINADKSIPDEVEEPKPLIEKPKNQLRYIGEAFNTYIIFEKNNKEIVIIDKHAAHERMIYEKLKKDKGAGFSQMLLEPIAVLLNKIDYDAAINNLDMFRECAFEIE